MSSSKPILEHPKCQKIKEISTLMNSKPKYNIADLNLDKATEFGVACDRDNTSGKLYYKLARDNHEQLIEMLTNDHYLYEMMNDQENLRFYFDLELKRKQPDDVSDEEQFKKDKNILDTALKSIIVNFWALYGIRITLDDLCCLNCCRKDKLSFHVIICKKVYAKNIAEAHTFALAVAHQMAQLAKENANFACLFHEGNCIVDTVVYKSKQLMRMVNQSKRHTKEGECPSGVMKFMDEKNTFADTLITLFNKTNLIMVDERLRQQVQPQQPVVEEAPKQLTEKELEIRRNKLEKVKNKFEAGKRFINDGMIQKTGKCLKDELNIPDSVFNEFPEWKQCLFTTRIQSNYNVWFAIGLAVLNCGGDLADFVAFSKLNVGHYVEGEEQMIVKAGRRAKGFKIGSLRYFSKVSNPEYYKNRLNPALRDYFTLDYREIHNLIRENSRYFSADANGDVNKNYETDSKFLIMHGKPGCGKSKIMKEIKDLQIKEKGDTKILCITPRCAFAIFAKDLFTLDYYKADNVKITESQRLAIQLESLTKLDEDKQTFDLIIMDEIESILKQFSSSTLTSNVKNTFRTLQTFIAKASKVILADGYIKQRTIDFAKSFIKPNDANPSNTITMLENNHDRVEKINAIQVNERHIGDNIKTDLRGGLNLYVSCGSKNVADKLYTSILMEGILTENDILYYSSASKKAVMNTLDKVEQHWNTKRLILVTPTVTCGISFCPEDKYFHRAYCITTNLSCVVSDVMQQIFRVRELIHNTVYFSVKRNTHVFGGNCFVNDVMATLNIVGPAFEDLCQNYVETLDKASLEYIENTNILKNYKDNKIDATLAKILLFNHEEAKLSRLYFTEMLLEFMKQSNFNITPLDVVLPDLAPTRVNWKDDDVRNQLLADYNEIAEIDGNTYNDNKLLLSKKTEEGKEAELENSKYAFLKFISDDTDEMDKAMLFYKFWQKKNFTYIKNVYNEKNKQVDEMAMNELIKKEGIILDCDMRCLRLHYVLQLNALLGLHGSYDTNTELTKEKMATTYNLLTQKHALLKNLFNLEVKLPIDTVASKNGFVYNMINGIYRKFNGNILEKCNKDELNHHNYNEAKYKLTGLNYGLFVKELPNRVRDIEKLLDAF